MAPRFDLIDIVKTVYLRRRFVVLVALLAGVCGLVFYMLQKKQYKARAEFIVSNPMFADRNHFFRVTGERYVDYFAGEDDIDRVIALGMSDLVKNQVIDRMGLYEKYKLNRDNAADVHKMAIIWKKNFTLLRTEYKNMEVYFSADDRKIAADVANESVRVIEETYRDYYNYIKGAMYSSLNDKLKESDSTVAALTDTLALLREEYQIFDIISPTRNTIINGNMKSNGHKDFGRGVEVIQNIESIKDQIVSDRAKYISLLNEFSTGTRPHELQFLKVISVATPPVNPAGFGALLTVVACTLLGLLLSVLIVLMNAYFRALIVMER